MPDPKAPRRKAKCQKSRRWSLAKVCVWSRVLKCGSSMLGTPFTIGPFVWELVKLQNSIVHRG
jgi:hypothetical protein